MNILITSAGRRVSLVRAFQKELKTLVPNGLVMTTDINIKLSTACMVSDRAFDLPPVSSQKYLKLLLTLCLNNEIKLVIPTIDTELILIAKNLKVFLDNNITPIISSLEFVKICRNKRNMNLFFLKNDISVAKEYERDDYKLPLYIKHLKGSRSIDNYIIKKKVELTSQILNNKNLMFLEYLDHDIFEEYTCDLYYDKNNDLKCIVPRKRIEVREGEVQKAVTQKNELINYIKERLNHIKGAKGCLTAQFFKNKNNNEIYGIEINARFGGGFPLTYWSGANYCKWIIEEYLFNKKIAFFNEWEENLLMLRYDHEILVHEYVE